MRRTDDTTAKHRAILETAARLICKKGYEGTSIQEIAANGPTVVSLPASF